MSIQTGRNGLALVVTIDRPEARSALSLAMTLELRDALRTLRDDMTFRVAILTGAGDQAFCAGADLKEIGAWYR
jgi:enoyl-CoA hydratase/carnithine racemase